MNHLLLSTRAEAFKHPHLAAHVASLQAVRPPPTPELGPADASLLAGFAGQVLLAVDSEDAPDEESVPGPLGRAVGKWLESTGEVALTAVLEGQVPWLSQPNDYPPVAAVQTGLRERFGDAAYAGALSATSRDGVSQLVAAMFWLGRCCASLPQIHLVSPGRPWVATICQYGQLHVERYAEVPGFEAQARKAGLVRVSECRRRGAIGGRALKTS